MFPLPTSKSPLSGKKGENCEKPWLVSSGWEAKSRWAGRGWREETDWACPVMSSSSSSTESLTLCWSRGDHQATSHQPDITLPQSLGLGRQTSTINCFIGSTLQSVITQRYSSPLSLSLSVCEEKQELESDLEFHFYFYEEITNNWTPSLTFLTVGELCQEPGSWGIGLAILLIARLS